MATDTKQKNVFSTILALWQYLGKKRRMQFFLLLLLMLVSVVAEVVSIGAVIPFLSALTKPKTLMNAGWFQPVLEKLSIQSPDDLLLPLTIAFIISAIFSAGVRLLLLWANTRLTMVLSIQLRTDVYTKALYQPYEYHIAQNSSQIISLATEKVGSTINSGILHVLLFMSNVVLTLAIIATLLVISPLVAVLTFVILGGSYVVIGYLVRDVIKRNGDIVARYQPLSVKCMQEGLGGIREVIIDNSQEVFRTTYGLTAQNIQQALLKNNFLGGLPKSLLEMIGIILLATLAYHLQKNSSGQQNILPVLGALALGAQRLLPGLQQIYYSWTAINGNRAIIEEVVEQLYRPSPTGEAIKRAKPFPFTEKIALNRLGFRYNGSETDTLQGIDLTLTRGSRTGIMGTTGSGKSTLLDIIMGLLPPTHGNLLVDGTIIDNRNVRSWQSNIAHVSQSIFLSDASMADNIAFGVPPEQIDLEAVQRAAVLAQIDTFIQTLPNGYQTLVGERGVRLSGGQRQRIGVARALFKQTDVLILDEATSALDSETEQKLMQAIDFISNNLTIIIIAHRLSTLKGCDTVIELVQGKIARQGSYTAMIQHNAKSKQEQHAD